MKRIFPYIGVLVLLFALLLSACGGNNNTNNQPSNELEVENTANQSDEEIALELTEEPAPEPTEELVSMIEVVDALGETMVLESPAQRIISLAPSITEILFAIGAGDQVVGREDMANYPEEALALPSIGNTFAGLNVEAIFALEPDLVLAAPLTSPEQVASLTDVGLTVFLLDNPPGVEGMYQTLRTAAMITGREVETEALIEGLMARVNVVLESVETAESTPLVYYELDATDPAAPWTTGPGTFIDDLITKAGGQNVAADLQGEWVQISSEELIVRNPDIIVLGNAMWGVTAEAVAARAGWEGITAVVNGAIFPFNDDLASRPGPRLVDGLEEMAELFHPELFE
jgi:iron complex transport system substrate-binding protein